jgi:hypothetical protein
MIVKPFTLPSRLTRDMRADEWSSSKIQPVYQIQRMRNVTHVTFAYAGTMQ